MIGKGQRTLLFATNLAHTMAHIYPYFLPTLTFVIRDDIPMNYTQAGLLAMIGLLVTIPLTIVFGFLGDKIRHWRLELIAGGFLLTISHTFVLFIADQYPILIVAAVICGIGAAVFHPIALPLLSQEFGADRSIAHSFNLIFGTTGSIITPISSIGLANWVGWRNTSLIFGIIGLVIFPILLFFLLRGKKQLDYQPQELMGLSQKNEIPTKERMTKKAGRLSNLTKRLPFLTLPLVIIIVTQIIRGGIFRVMNTFTAFIFEDRFGASELISALIMSSILGAGGIAALVSGFISRKHGSLRIFFLSLASTTVAAIFTTSYIGLIDITGASIGIGWLLVAIALFIILAMSFYAGSPAANALLAELVPGKVLCSVYGVVNALMTGFSAVSPVLFGLIVDQHYHLPYEYLLLVVFAAVPLLLIVYVKNKIGFKTPDEIDAEGGTIIPCQDSVLGK